MIHSAGYPSGLLSRAHAGSGLVVPDSATDRVFFLNTATMMPTPLRMQVFDQDSFLLLQTYTLNGITGAASSFVGTGPGRFAFRTDGGRVYLLQLVDLDYVLLVPSLQRGCTIGICGQVTQYAAPVANLPLELRFFNGSSWSSMGSTTTNESGRYTFANVPSLGPNQRYYVRFLNTGNTPGRLWGWSTRVLTTYTAGENVPMPAFEIGDVSLLSPATGTSLPLPQVFQWAPRPTRPSDAYALVVYDPGDGQPQFVSDPVAGAASYSLTALPQGFSLNTPYAWEVWVFSPDGGAGVSLGTFDVRFTSALTMQSAEVVQSLEPADPRSDLRRP